MLALIPFGSQPPIELNRPLLGYYYSRNGPLILWTKNPTLIDEYRKVAALLRSRMECS
jgi:hypothetical protein